jgi:hypothetical protein
MSLKTGIIVFAICGAGIACGSASSPSEPSTTTTTTTTPTPTPNPGGSATWTLEGVRLTAATAGLVGQTTLADSTTIRLNDGRYRMYMFAGDNIRSAISSDGLSFTMESGARLPQGSGQSRAIRLTDGRIRIFYATSTGLGSAISTDDGANFTVEAGLRISGSAAGMSQLTGPGIIRLANGTYRAYFSDLPIPGQGILPHMIKSATSTDLFTWTVESGVRIGPGATLSGNSEHPCAILNPDGSTTIFYFRNTDTRLYYSTSADGLTFTTETTTGISQANDPDIVTLADGSVRLYYNWTDSGGGIILSAKRATANLTFR